RVTRAASGEPPVRPPKVEEDPQAVPASAGMIRPRPPNVSTACQPGPWWKESYLADVSKRQTRHSGPVGRWSPQPRGIGTEPGIGHRPPDSPDRRVQQSRHTSVREVFVSPASSTRSKQQPEALQEPVIQQLIERGRSQGYLEPE